MSTDNTDRLVTGKDTTSLAIGNTSANEILDLLLMTLKDNPLRADLWLMRFDILRTVGLKENFASALKEAYANSRLRQEMDWVSVRRMWDELSAGAPPPDGVVLPKSQLKTDEKEQKIVIRRFSDIALKIAGSELKQLAQDYQALRSRPDFYMDFARATRKVLHRPTPMHHAQALQRELGSSSRIFLKREDQHHSSPEMEMAAAHAHFAVSMGKQFILTGNDVDEFSLALARVATQFGSKLTVVVGLLEIDSKSALVTQLRELDVQVEIMRDSELNSRDPREGALRLWTRMPKTCHLALSFGTGPNPYPRMVSDFQMLLGYESELQLRAQGGADHERTLVASVHSEADSIGFMLPYLKRQDIDLFYAEPVNADGRTIWKSSKRLLAYNGARREHSWLRASGRITHVPINDAQARVMQEQVWKLEAISISLEDARAVALAAGLVKGEAGDRDIVVLVG